MKILMIGPVYPYSTGLSYYTGLMYKNLKEHHDVEMISYKMQYPKILFKRKQVDYEDDVVKIEEAQYLINTANPFNWISVARKLNRKKADLVIFQWLHPYFAPCFTILAKLLKHTKILFVCHNVFPHERFVCDRFLTKMTMKQGDYYITHSLMDADDLKSIIKEPNYKINVHPAYNFFKLKNMTKEQAREVLHIEEKEKVLLFFGLIREYKGLKHLLNAMPEIKKEIPEIKLLIAGEFCGNKEEYENLIQENDIQDVVNVYGGHLPTEEVEKFFAACDLVVLPYESATQSGVIQVAYSFDKAVVATNVGGLPDVVENMKTGYIVESKKPVKIAEAVKDFFENERAQQFAEGIEAVKYKYSWDKMRETIESFME